MNNGRFGIVPSIMAIRVGRSGTAPLIYLMQARGRMARAEASDHSYSGFHFDRLQKIKLRFAVYILIALGSGNPGIAASAGSPIRFEQVEGSIFSSDLRSAGSSMTHDVCRGCVVDFHEWSDS